MERLTFEVYDGGMFVKESDVKTFEVEDEVMHTGNAIRKLADYEELEEQGKLLKLPCAVGDYAIFSNRDILPVVYISITHQGIVVGCQNGVTISMWCKNWCKGFYKTYEQAKSALQEMEE